MMNYIIENKEAFQIIGRTETMTYANPEFWRGIVALWDEWNGNDLCAKIGNKYSSDKPGYQMEISQPMPTAEDPLQFTHTVGCIYNGAENTDGYSITTVPAGKYAVFSVPQEYADDVGQFMGKIIEHLKSEGHELAGVELGYFTGPDSEWNDGWQAWVLIKD